MYLYNNNNNPHNTEFTYEQNFVPTLHRHVVLVALMLVAVIVIVIVIYLRSINPSQDTVLWI
jgi:hypothetical protein